MLSRAGQSIKGGETPKSDLGRRKHHAKCDSSKLRDINHGDGSGGAMVVWALTMCHRAPR